MQNLLNLLAITKSQILIAEGLFVATNCISIA